MASQKPLKDLWKVYEEEKPSSTHHFTVRSVCLLESLELKHLRPLMESFSRQRFEPGRKVRACDRVPANSMSFEDFFSSLKETTSQDYQRSDVEEFFNEMGIACDDRIELETFQTFMLQYYKQSIQSMEACKSVPISHPLIRKCTYKKQGPIARVLALTRSPPMHYVSVSKRGALIVWDHHLNNMKPLEACAKRFQGWITDAVYMANVRKIAVATLNKGIHFFDVTTASGFEQVHLYGLTHFATALCYWYDTEAPGEKCVLMWGDEKGSVNLLWFLQPLKGLFKMHFTNQTGPVMISLQDIYVHNALVSHQQIPNLHCMQINRILYEVHGELIITSSDSSASSVIITDVNQKREKYIWSIKKGVRCFDFSFSLSLLVTAGEGPTVRLWNRYVTSRPTALLHSHRTAVVDVVIHQELGKIFSYSKDAVLKIWDIPSEQCIKTVHLNFPNIQAGVDPEHGSFPLLLNLTPDPVLMATCREYLAMLRLDSTESSSRHSLYPCALYNPHLKEVITASADSTLTVWDVKTGIKRMVIESAHGTEEVSCMALDVHQRRLISAATNGTIKVWNLLNGCNLHKLEPVSNTEVTGIICHHNQLLATGWSRQIAQYSFTLSREIYVKAELSWKSDRPHSEDILAMDHCPALGLLATGSCDGEIIIWTMALQKPFTRLQTSQQQKVHRLLFLQSRAQQMENGRNAAVLLSSQAGSVCWWSVCGPTHNHGQFYVPNKSGENVMGLSTDRENHLLVTGDTTGSIKVWDISRYALTTGDTESPAEFPPLLHSWRGHKSAIVSSEVLLYESRLFFLSVSVDNRACLWTGEGDYVGCFGQEQQWDLIDPDTYQTNREHTGPIRDLEEEEKIKDSQSSASAQSFTSWGERSGEADHQQTGLHL